MYNKMLVLLDGSKLAEVVFTYAQQLSARLNITLELLHVCNPQEAEQLPMRKAYVEHMAEILKSKALEIRSKSGLDIQGKNVQARGKVVVGYPAEEIIKYADKNNIDMIMLSTHGRSGMRVWDLGSVADKVIHAAKVPIWLVPSELREEVIWDKLPKRTIVIPLDGSKLSEVAVPHVIKIVKQRGVQFEIVLIYVDDPRVYGESTFITAKQQKDAFSSMKRYLESQVQRIVKEGITARAEMFTGGPAFAIVEFLKNNPTQLLAMATHGHVGISRMVFGSVAEDILHTVKNTPILLVRSSE